MTERYTWRNGRFVDRDGRPMKTSARFHARFNILREMEPYRSPVDGRLVRNARERRDDLKRNDCVEYGPSLFARASDRRRAKPRE